VFSRLGIETPEKRNQLRPSLTPADRLPKPHIFISTECTTSRAILPEVEYAELE
jgi:hypothetical protein